MSKAAIRNKKYATAIRAGIMAGREAALLWGVKLNNNYHVDSILAGLGYTIIFDAKHSQRESDIAWQVSWDTFDKQLVYNIANVWTDEEYATRKEQNKINMMDSVERQEYLLRKEVAELRSEVDAWNKIVGVRA